MTPTRIARFCWRDHRRNPCCAGLSALAARRVSKDQVPSDSVGHLEVTDGQGHKPDRAIRIQSTFLNTSEDLLWDRPGDACVPRLTSASLLPRRFHSPGDPSPALLPATRSRCAVSSACSWINCRARTLAASSGCSCIRSCRRSADLFLREDGRILTISAPLHPGDDTGGSVDGNPARDTA